VPPLQAILGLLFTTDFVTFLL